MVFPPDYDTVAITNLDAYKRNIQKIISHIGDSVQLMAVVKANAYGHGMAECAQTALDAGASILGVAFASEGAKLREAGITAPILVMAQESFDHIPSLIENDLIISLASFIMLDELKTVLTQHNSSCRVHIKVDTGMGRIGIQPDDALSLVEKAWNTPGITVKGIFTHFPSADEEKDPFSQNQIEVFNSLLKKLTQKGIRPKIAHMCNSAGTLKFPEAHLDLVRTGIMTYGLIPYPGSEEKLTFEPVMSLKSRISFIKEVPAGFGVSYGSTFTAKRPSRLATVPLGYGDGYNRHLSNKGKAIVNSVIVPVVGRVCMDQTVFDITDAGDVREGDPIILIGREGDKIITIEEHAQIAGTISYEIVTGITGRVSRFFIPAT